MGSVSRFAPKIKDYRIFVETGTSHGGGANFLASICEHGFTIDIIDNYKNRVDNVSFLLGESTKHLEHLCQEIEDDCVFWLDAHYPKDYNAEGEELPLVEELKIIAKYRQDKKDLILIDDLRIYIHGNFQSGNLPNSHKGSDENILRIVEELFPDRKYILEYADEGYLIIEC